MGCLQFKLPIELIHARSCHSADVNEPSNFYLLTYSPGCHSFVNLLQLMLSEIKGNKTLIIRTSLLRHLQAKAAPVKCQPEGRKDCARLCNFVRVLRRLSVADP